MKYLKTLIYIAALLAALTLILSGCDTDKPDTAAETETESAVTEAETETETETETEIPMINVFGRLYPQDTPEITLDKDEIESFDSLVLSLNFFTDLKSIDLGEYGLSIDEKQRLNLKFPDAEIKCRTYILLSGREIYTDSTEIDLCGLENITAEKIREILALLPDAAHVVSDTAVPIDDKTSLKADFPGISFEIPAVVDVYGVQLKEDAAELDLNGIKIDADELAKKLEYLPYMKTVNLTDSGIDEDSQFRLASEYPYIKFLWQVDILGKQYGPETEDLDLSEETELTLNLARRKLMLMSWLKRVDLSDINATNEELAALREEFPNIKIVWKLYMGKWSLKTDAIAFSVLIYNYNYTRLTSDDIQCLKYCTDLQALDLGHQAITDISVIGEYLKELRILILVDNKISDLTPISNLKHLHYIELFVNGQLKDVSPLGECKELVDVNISHLYNIRDISNLLDLPLLERLWIEHTAVSDSDIQLLYDTYPNAKIIVEGYGSVDQGWREHPRYYAMFDMFKKTNYMSEEFSKYDR